MAEITSNVFDIFHPTPAPLRELSAIVISLEVWRCEINKYRSSGSLKDFRPDRSVSSRTMIPGLPSQIYPMLDKYVASFGLSMNNWLQRHDRAIFYYYYDNKNAILEYFQDFVCEYNGTIDYERTSERMMHCDRFDMHQKFLIACTYCFEDDIVRIWPALGLKNTDSLYKRYSQNPQFAYWINFLENHIKITDPTIEEWVLSDFMPHSRSSIEYFWNVTSPENRLRAAIEICLYDLPSLVRFILPKLGDFQLDEFLYVNGCELLYCMLKRSWYDEEFVLSVWIWVKEAMNESAFQNLIEKVMQSEVRGYCDMSELHQNGCFWVVHVDEDGTDEDRREDLRDIDDVIRLCIEIWNTAADNLKCWAVQFITRNTLLFNDIFFWFESPPTSGEYKLSLAVLSYATYEQRNAFWHNCWRYLIVESWGEGMQKMMRLCLRDEEEITQFKKTTMANDGRVRSFCNFLLTESMFDELNGLLRFLFHEEEAARNFKRWIGYNDD